MLKQSFSLFFKMATPADRLLPLTYVLLSHRLSKELHVLDTREFPECKPTPIPLQYKDVKGLFPELPL